MRLRAIFTQQIVAPNRPPVEPEPSFGRLAFGLAKRRKIAREALDKRSGLWYLDRSVFGGNRVWAKVFPDANGLEKVGRKYSAARDIR
jgi:hypothetical protein